MDKEQKAVDEELEKLTKELQEEEQRKSEEEQAEESEEKSEEEEKQEQKEEEELQKIEVTPGMIYVIDGEEYTADKLGNLRKSSMMEADYTRKTQAVAKREEELNRIIDEQKAREADFTAFISEIRQNPEKLKEYGLMPEEKADDPEPDLEEDPLAWKEWMKRQSDIKINALKKQFDDYQNKVNSAIMNEELEKHDAHVAKQLSDNCDKFLTENDIDKSYKSFFMKELENDEELLVNDPYNEEEVSEAIKNSLNKANDFLKDIKSKSEEAFLKKLKETKKLPASAVKGGNALPVKGPKQKTDYGSAPGEFAERVAQLEETE